MQYPKSKASYPSNEGNFSHGVPPLPATAMSYSSTSAIHGFDNNTISSIDS